MHDEVVDKVFNKKESPQKRHKNILPPLSADIGTTLLFSTND